MAVARGVAAFVHTNWVTLEGDFQVYHGLNLITCCYGPDQVGVRRLKVLVEALPPESATAQALRTAWTERDEQGAVAAELLADISRSLRHLITLQLTKNRTFTDPMPLVWPRPAIAVPPKPTAPTGPPVLTRDAVRSALTRRRR